MAMKNPTIADMASMTISTNQIKFAGEKGFSEQPWTNFKETIEDDDSLLLYLSKQNFFIIPKRYFSKEDVDLIRTSIKPVSA